MYYILMFEKMCSNLWVRFSVGADFEQLFPAVKSLVYELLLLFLQSMYPVEEEIKQRKVRAERYEQKVKKDEVCVRENHFVNCFQKLIICISIS